MRKIFFMLSLTLLSCFFFLVGCGKTTVTVKFVLNGGESDVTSITAFQGEKIPAVPTPVNGKKFFIGWYTDGGALWDFSRDVIKKDTTLNAKWSEEDGVLVQFSANLAGMTPTETQSQLLAKGGAVCKPSDPQVQDGSFLFSGWFYDSECALPFSFTSQAAEVSQDLTLFAGWKRAHLVTFEGGVKRIERRVGQGDLVEMPNVTKSGFFLDNWYTDENKTITFDASAPITQDITLYANFFEETPPDKFEFKEEKRGTNTVYSYSVVLKADVGEKVVLPATYNNKPVTRFEYDSNFFANYAQLKTICYSGNIQEPLNYIDSRFQSEQYRLSNKKSQYFIEQNGCLFSADTRYSQNMYIPNRYPRALVKAPTGWGYFYSYSNSNLVFEVDYNVPSENVSISIENPIVVADQYFAAWSRENSKNVFKASDVKNNGGFLIQNGAIRSYIGDKAEVVVPGNVKEIRGSVLENAQKVILPSSVHTLEVGSLKNAQEVYFSGTCPNLVSQWGNPTNFGGGDYSNESSYYEFTPSATSSTKYYALAVNLQSFDQKSWYVFDKDQTPTVLIVKKWEVV